MDKYEREHLTTMQRLQKAVEEEYRKMIGIIVPLIIVGAPRSTIARRLDDALSETNDSIANKIDRAILASWELSDKKNLATFAAYLHRADSTLDVDDIFKPNVSAREAFLRRKVKGLDLSKRVWKSTRRSRRLILAQVDAGIEAGTSAAKLSRDLMKELKNPTYQEHPGQGVYKSPIKNAIRLARNETNIAYRSADQVSWENNDLVIGQQISLSDSPKVHARCEICRGLAGVYPKDFVWHSWHPNCLCIKTPVLMSDSEFELYRKALLAGEKYTPKNGVTKMPSQFTQWIQQNNERVMGWKSVPLFWKDNGGIIKKVLG